MLKTNQFTGGTFDRNNRVTSVENGAGSPDHMVNNVYAGYAGAPMF